MFYRITFNTQSCMWEVSLQRLYGLYWSKLNGQAFANIESAEDYVQQVGIDRVYRDWRNTHTHMLMSGGLP